MMIPATCSARDRIANWGRADDVFGCGVVNRDVGRLRVVGGVEIQGHVLFPALQALTETALIARFPGD
jgi:hypothetical protein